MGNFMEKPDTKIEVDVGEGNGLRYCVSSMQGWRLAMEDAHTAICGLREPNESLSFFGVFDGHAGSHIAAHCAENLLTAITKTKSFSKAQFEDSLREGILLLDQEMQVACSDSLGGSTATCVLVSPQKIYLANCGDSRAVVSLNGKAALCTVDHRPTSPDEKARIQKAGGCILIERVNGCLAVSRALGDYQFKLNTKLAPTDQMVSAEPDIFVWERTLKDEFVIIACDGIWDVMNSDEVCAYIHSRLLVTDDLPQIVNSVLDVCLHKDSRDNMTLMLLLLPGAPTVNEDAVRADENLDHSIDRLTRDVMEKNDIYFFDDLISLMTKKSTEIKNLPPGGGLYSKYHIIKKVFQEKDPKTTTDYDRIYT